MRHDLARIGAVCAQGTVNALRDQQLEHGGLAAARRRHSESSLHSRRSSDGRLDLRSDPRGRQRSVPAEARGGLPRRKPASCRSVDPSFVDTTYAGASAPGAGDEWATGSWVDLDMH
jgi:hypothetical protein